MKKLFVFLMITGMVAFGISCSNDDGKKDDPIPVNKTLVLSGSPTTVKVNESVDFTVKFAGKVEAGAELYIGSEKISNPYTFTTVGIFEVVAKKIGFKDSNVVKITVTEENAPEENVLILATSPNGGEINVGANITFTFIFNGDAVNDAVLFLNDVQIAGDEYTVVEADAGQTLKFNAKKGETISNDVIFNVAEIVPEPDGNYLKVGETVHEINSYSLFANCSQGADDLWYVHRYTHTESGTQYCIFYVDLGKINDAGTHYDARSFTSFVVIQDPNDTDIVLPGVNPITNDVFIFSSMTDYVSPEIEFLFEEMTAFEFPTQGIEEGVVNIGASNTKGGFKYNGAYEGLYVVKVDANGNQIQNRSSSTVGKQLDKKINFQKAENFIKK